MKKYTLIAFTLGLMVWSSCSTAIKIPGDDPMGRLTADVAYLASDYLEGRETGTEGELKAAEYIAERFSECGLTPKGDNGTFYQIFQRQIKMNPHDEHPSEDDPTIVGRNVIGFADNQAAKTVVIGAHYDHLGYGMEGSLHTGEPAIHNGADDNASGVAAMIYLAKMLQGNKQTKKYNYLFIGFSGEEKGLWGSNYYVDHPTIPISSMAFMVNMDMVGRLNKERQLAVHGYGTSSSWPAILGQIKSDFKFSFSESGIGPSDHTSFYLEDVPVLHFFTGQHSDYHKPSDDIQYLNYLGIRDVAQYIYKIIYTSQKHEIPFVKTKDESTEAPRFNVTLGVIPDYLYDGKGMRIDGVRVGKTASLYGIIDGDIVVRMGDLEIIDMMSYMKALSAFEVGQTVDVTVIRDGEKVVKSVTF